MRSPANREGVAENKAPQALTCGAKKPILI
jgi:hypothetical protein